MTGRRSAIVLHADIAGYSRLMEGAQTRVLGRLLALRRGVWEPAIASHGGRVAKTQPHQDQRLTRIKQPAEGPTLHHV